MALGLLASIGIPFITDMISKYGEKAVTAGVKKVTGVDITKRDLTPAEKQLVLDAEVKLREFDFKEMKLSFENTESAREMNARVQEAENASDWAKISPYLLDFLIVGATIILGFLLFGASIPDANKELAYMMFGSLLSLCGTVVNFHRGSSQSSKDKDDVLKEMKK